PSWNLVWMLLVTGCARSGTRGRSAVHARRAVVDRRGVDRNGPQPGDRYDLRSSGALAARRRSAGTTLGAMRWALLAITAACGRIAFDPVAAHDGGSIDASTSPLHLAPANGVYGNGSLTLTVDATIDTSVPSTTFALPAGDSFDIQPHLGGGP